MWATTDAFQQAVRDGGHAVVRAEVLDPDGAVIDELEVQGGTVKVERNSAVRRDARNLTIVDPAGDYVPASGGDLLHPATRNELKLYRGFHLDGTVELVPLGVFGIQRPTADETRRKIGLTGYDRARRVQRAKLTDTYVITAGTNYADAIRNLIASRVSGLTYEFMVTTRTTPLLVFEAGDDPWEKAQKMADSLGAQLYFDAEGRCVLEPEPDVSGLPVWTFGADDATVLSADKDLDDEQTYNGAIVTGETTSAATPVRAEAWDDNPDSPTYRGTFGEVPTFLTSQYITTQTQAQDAADALLARKLGVVENVGFDALVNPALDVGDVIGVERAWLRIDDVYLLDRLTVPLDHRAGMSAATRRRVTA